MISFIRGGQPVITRINPHNGNNQYIKISNEEKPEPPVETVAVPDIVGLTAVAADAAIVAAGLVVGTVTGTVDPVASQDPAASTVVNIGTAVDYALTS